MRPADRVIVAAAAALVAASWLALWRPAAAGDAVRVSVPGAEATEFPLADDREVAVDGLLGRSTLEIRAGRVRFTDSPCVGRYCVHSGWLSSSGDVAACLPNGVVAEVVGKERPYDALSF